MKAAYHFIADHPEVGDLYARSIIRTLTGAALSPPPLSLWTKVFVGDLLLHRLGMDRREEDNTVIETPNTRKLKRAIDLWLHSDLPVVTRLRDDVSQLVLRHRVFVVCLESVDEDSALRLHDRMSHYEPYCGMMEVDEASVVHWYLYSGALTPFGRMSGTRATLFWNGLDEEPKNHAFVAALRESGLQSCTFEALNGRYTLFDANHKSRSGSSNRYLEAPCGQSSGLRRRQRCQSPVGYRPRARRQALRRVDHFRSSRDE
jgi:hypothetical protein